MAKETPPSLFDLDDVKKWSEEWKDMPEFVQRDMSPFQSIIVHFESEEDMKEFSKVIGQNITHRTKSIWFPKYNRERPSNYIYDQENES